VSLKSEIASAGALAAGSRARWPLAVADSSKGGMVAEAPGSRVFISYRREDSGYPAGWLFDQLAASLGADRVFKDVDSIEPGDDFAEVISDAVSDDASSLALPPVGCGRRENRGRPLEGGGCRPGELGRPGAHHRPRGSEDAHPGCICHMRNMTTPMGSGGRPPVSPTVRPGAAATPG